MSIARGSEATTSDKSGALLQLQDKKGEHVDDDVDDEGEYVDDGEYEWEGDVDDDQWELTAVLKKKKPVSKAVGRRLDDEDDHHEADESFYCRWVHRTTHEVSEEWITREALLDASPKAAGMLATMDTQGHHNNSHSARPHSHVDSVHGAALLQTLLWGDAPQSDALPRRVAAAVAANELVCVRYCHVKDHKVHRSLLQQWQTRDPGCKYPLSMGFLPVDDNMLHNVVGGTLEKIVAEQPRHGCILLEKKRHLVAYKHPGAAFKCTTNANGALLAVCAILHPDISNQGLMEQGAAYYVDSYFFHSSSMMTPLMILHVRNLGQFASEWERLVSMTCPDVTTAGGYATLLQPVTPPTM